MKRFLWMIALVMMPLSATEASSIREPLTTVLTYLFFDHNNPSLDRFKELFVEAYAEELAADETFCELFALTKGPRPRRPRIHKVNAARAVDAYLNEETNVPREVKIALYKIDNHLDTNRDLSTDGTTAQLMAQHDHERKLLANNTIKLRQHNRTVRHSELTTERKNEQKRTQKRKAKAQQLAASRLMSHAKHKEKARQIQQRQQHDKLRTNRRNEEAARREHLIKLREQMRASQHGSS